MSIKLLQRNNPHYGCSIPLVSMLEYLGGAHKVSFQSKEVLAYPAVPDEAPLWS